MKKFKKNEAKFLTLVLMLVLNGITVYFFPESNMIISIVLIISLIILLMSLIIFYEESDSND